MASLKHAVLVVSCLGSMASARPADAMETFPTRSLFDEAQKLADPTYGPKPGEADIFNDYYGVAPPFPGGLRAPVLATEEGKPDPDDHVWQNLLSAEWVIFDFYQQGVEAFNESSFIEAGFPNSTYKRIMEIRNNEAGHLRLFQNQISPRSVKPGACRHQFPIYDPAAFLGLTTVLEISSMAFLTGLVQQVTQAKSRGAMVAIAETETRHETWTLLDIWKANPFGGPSDTAFPYANQILDTTRAFVVPGSCPKQNPEYPSPRQNLPALGVVAKDTTSITPGSVLALDFPDPTNQPEFKEDKQYYGVFFHGLMNASVPLEMGQMKNGKKAEIRVKIPEEFETKGVIVAVVADKPGAPTKESVIAGPAVALEQPVELGLKLAKGE